MISEIIPLFNVVGCVLLLVPPQITIDVDIRHAEADPLIDSCSSVAFLRMASVVIALPLSSKVADVTYCLAGCL